MSRQVPKDVVLGWRQAFRKSRQVYLGEVTDGLAGDGRHLRIGQAVAQTGRGGHVGVQVADPAVADGDHHQGPDIQLNRHRLVEPGFLDAGLQHRAPERFVVPAAQHRGQTISDVLEKRGDLRGG